MKNKIVLIERPDGSTFEQNIGKMSIKEYQQILGKDYWIVDWWYE